MCKIYGVLVLSPDKKQHKIYFETVEEARTYAESLHDDSTIIHIFEYSCDLFNCKEISIGAGKWLKK